MLGVAFVQGMADSAVNIRECICISDIATEDTTLGFGKSSDMNMYSRSSMSRRIDHMARKNVTRKCTGFKHKWPTFSQAWTGAAQMSLVGMIIHLGLS